MERYGHHHPLWNTHLKKYDVSWEYFQYIVSPNQTQNFCVIVEPRQMEELPLVIKNFMYLLQHKNWGLIVVHGTQNEDFIKSRLKGWKNVVFHNLNVENLSLHDYNSLMLNCDFWNTIRGYGCKKALVFQTDTLLLKNNIDDFLEYDYVGAPWTHSCFSGVLVGNGGLSLRDTEKMILITEKYTNDVHNEDTFISYCCSLEGFNVPSLEIAKGFSVESVFYENPMGLHKPILDKIGDVNFESLFEDKNNISNFDIF